MYKLTSTSSVIRLSDGACIPAAGDNSDYTKYLAWIANGNTPEPVDVPTNEQIQATLSDAVQRHLDTAARQHRYDNIHTACGWAGEFTDAGALKAWAAACWRKAGEVEAAVASGARRVPTEVELIAELPAPVLP